MIIIKLMTVNTLWNRIKKFGRCFFKAIVVPTTCISWQLNKHFPIKKVLRIHSCTWMAQKNGFRLTNDIFLQTTQYIEHSGFTALFKTWYQCYIIKNYTVKFE